MKDKRVEVLTELIFRTTTLNFSGIDKENPNFDIWKNDVRRVLKKTFGENHDFLKQFNSIRFKYYGYRPLDGMEVPLDLETYKNGILKAAGLLTSCIKEIEDEDTIYVSSSKNESTFSFEEMLHPYIEEKALKLFKDSYYQESIKEALMVLFSLIRSKSSLSQDGDDLINNALSTSNPRLILAELETSSGQNIQKGFMNILKGVVGAIRNPLAHSKDVKFTPIEAARYLVFISLLLYKIDEATPPKH